jgi:aspartate/glutamate racemase
VLTACTEIPLVLGRDSLGSIPLLDPMAVAAEEAIEIALGRRPLPVESPAFLD